jgi:uncharacterized membrane protein YphA (DoxX/SURF4 family)
MKIENMLDQLHLKARRNPLLQRFAQFNRLLFGIAFIAPGLTKVLGNRFTILSLDSPVGFFFEAMYRTGFYWRFLGIAQILASLMLLIPRTASLGAVAFFPIILNIFIITVSMQFTGTWVVTGLMLLANLYLLCWDYHKFKPLFFNTPAPAESWAVSEAEPHWVERIGYAAVLISGMTLTIATRNIVLPYGRAVILGGLAVGFCGGLLLLAGWWLTAQRFWQQGRVGAVKGEICLD